MLAKDGGLLKRLRPMVKAGVGGQARHGRQFMPWISLTDEIAAIRFLLEHDVAGPVNLTAPTPVRNAEFTRTLGRLVAPPAPWCRCPASPPAIVLGEFAEDVLTGQRAVPARLRGRGLRVPHTDLEPALRAVLD